LVGDLLQSAGPEGLHDQIKVGDILEVSAPAGDFVLTPSDSPLLLASAGAAITTVLPIVEHIVRTQPRRPVIAARADRTAQDHALRQTVQRMGHQLDNFTSYTWCEYPDPGDTSSPEGTWIYRTFRCLMTSTS
jgi:nitric oxide dioxygenase